MTLDPGMSVLLTWLDDAPLYVLGLLLLLGMLGAAAAGHLVRIRHRRRGRAAERESLEGFEGYIVSAVLGLLALLMAFTFSLAIDRFDARRLLVLEDANAIGTAYLRAQMLPAPLRDETRALLRDYVDVRVDAGSVSITRDEDWASLMARAGWLQNALWDKARRAAEADPSPVPSGMFVQATNDLIDSFGRRDAALHRHVPEVVLFLLLGTFLITSAIVGFSGGVVGRRPPLVSFAMVLLIVVLVFVILDLDRPIRGLIVVSEKNLRDLQASMKAETAPAGGPALPGSAAAPARAASR